MATHSSKKKTGGKQRTRKKPTTHKAALNPQPKKAHTKRPTPQQTSNADGRKSDDESVDDAVLLLRRDRSSDTAAPTSSTCEVSSTWASSGLCAAGGCSAEPQAGERLANATARSADDQWPFSVASWRGRPGLKCEGNYKCEGQREIEGARLINVVYPLLAVSWQTSTRIIPLSAAPRGLVVPRGTGCKLWFE